MFDPILWEGNITSFPANTTPLGYYDNDAQFQIDSVGFSNMAASILGFPTIDVELQASHMLTAYEYAVNEYANAVYRWKIKDNYINLEGTTSSSSINNTLVVPSLGNIIRIAKTYGSEAGSGGLVNWYSGSIKVQAGRQNYSLKQWAYLSGSLAPGDSIEIKKVFHQGIPASVRWLDPNVGTTDTAMMALDIMGWTNMGIPINYMMTPVSHDIARFQAIEFNDQIRRSGYSFELHNNELKIFPIPAYDSQIWFEYIKVSERDSVNPVATMPGTITNPSNVPIMNIVYSTINAPGKQWIQAYALGMVKTILGQIRNKFSTIPIPGSEVSLGQSLIDQGTSEMQKLVEALDLFLTGTSRKAQLEKQAEEAQHTKAVLTNIPMLIYSA